MISRTCGKRHCSLSIAGALKQIPNNDRQSFADDDNGRPLTNRQLRTILQEAHAEGKRVLPMGDCNNFDYQTGCRGHDVVLLVNDWEFEEGNG
jgi:hypothetical protein